MNPQYAQGRQVYSDRERVFRARRIEAGGGETAYSMGTLIGMTSGWWAYTYLHKAGFAFRPYQRHKVGKYTIIAGAFFLGYQFGRASVATITADDEQYKYLSVNKVGIILGNMPMERSHYRLTEQK